MTKKSNTKSLVLGIMSGTSLDGLDLAVCEFSKQSDQYTFKILAAETIRYTTEWKKSLTEAKNLKAEEYFKLNAKYGQFIGEQVKDFIKKTHLHPTAIASHGHTIFHQPHLGFSTQLGCGAQIAAVSGLTTVCDFRSLDIAMGGQGAPLVPIGDALLFGQHSACLNLGGIANISFEHEGKRIAYDICEANMLLNYLAEKENQDYDKGGEIARSGKVDETLLHQLNHLDYYSQQGAKSLGREWFEKQIIPLVDAGKLSVKDVMATSVEHIATIVSRELNLKKLETCLLSGGGTWNSFLIDKIRSKTTSQLIIPEHHIVEFKEALIFAFLGYLRLQHQINTLASVSGATSNSIGGAVYFVY